MKEPANGLTFTEDEASVLREILFLHTPKRALTDVQGKRRVELARAFVRLAMIERHAAGTNPYRMVDVEAWVLDALMGQTGDTSDLHAAQAAANRALSNARRAGQKAGQRLVEAAKRNGPSPEARRKMAAAARRQSARRARSSNGSFLPAGQRKDAGKETAANAE